jgi:hypothetical protein
MGAYGLVHVSFRADHRCNEIGSGMSGFTVTASGFRYIVKSPDDVTLGYYPSKESADIAYASFVSDSAKAKAHCTVCDSVYFRHLYTPGNGFRNIFMICVECGADAPPNVANAQLVDV